MVFGISEEGVVPEESTGGAWLTPFQVTCKAGKAGHRASIGSFAESLPSSSALAAFLLQGMLPVLVFRSLTFLHVPSGLLPNAT